MRVVAVTSSGQFGEINLVSSGRSIVPLNGATPATANAKKQLIAENANRLLFRVQNRSMTAEITVWVGALGVEEILQVLKPGASDAGDMLVCSAVKNRISLSSTEASTPYFASEVL